MFENCQNESVLTNEHYCMAIVDNPIYHAHLRAKRNAHRNTVNRDSERDLCVYLVQVFLPRVPNGTFNFLHNCHLLEFEG